MPRSQYAVRLAGGLLFLSSLLFATVSSAATLSIGERIYREGVLPSGEPVQAVLRGDVLVDGTTFTCISCHLSSGLGSFEGTVRTPPTNGVKLYQPLKISYNTSGVLRAPMLRPAYTDQSLAEALRAGVNSSGQALNDVMPRYMLDDPDMAALIAYLKSLSSQPSPGVYDGKLHFATVITQDVSAEEQEALMVPLENYITKRNNQVKVYESSPKLARVTEVMFGTKQAVSMKLSLSKWMLKGPPETWRSQLDEYYANDPVFALVGGITKGGWKPVHDFCEENRIPCILPITDYPVVSGTDWYTLYYSKGYYQEGESAARYLNSRENPVNDEAVVQVVRDSPEGRALSEGFVATWLALGRKTPVTVTLKEGETLTSDILHGLAVKEKTPCILLWDGPEALPALDLLATGNDRPDTVIVSSGYLGKSLWTLGDQAREFTCLTYPYRLPQDEARQKAYLMTKGKMDVKGDAELVLKRTHSLILVLAQAVMDLRGDYYRDRFLDAISMMQDLQAPLYERLSFGPGQRYASKGCYIVQLTKGPDPQMVKKSAWVIH